MKVVVGSTSEHKVEAVRAALDRLGIDAEVLSLKAASGVNEQPMGPDETFEGAYRRAVGAFQQSWADMSIGIESGIVRFAHRHGIGFPDAFIDLAIVVVMAAGRTFYATSAGVPFDRVDVHAAGSKGYISNTAGQAMAARVGCDPTDPVDYLTGGEVSRADLIADAVRIALAQWLRVERGAVESFPASAITMSMPALMCERVAGGLYLVDVLSIVRAEHVGVSWIAGVASVSGPMLLGVVRGRVVAAAPPLLTAISAPSCGGMADLAEERCPGSGAFADFVCNSLSICPRCHTHVNVVTWADCDVRGVIVRERHVFDAHDARGRRIEGGS